MFNTYNQSPRHVSHTHESVSHEHRAPTDASVKLLKELESAAMDKILSVNKLENNTLECHWAITRDRLSFHQAVQGEFLLNDKKHHFTFTVPYPYPIEQFAGKLHAKITEEVARVITIDLIRKHAREICPQK